MNKNQIYKKIKLYYPLNSKNNQLPRILLKYLKILSKKQNGKYDTRFEGNYGKDYYQELINKFSKIPLSIQSLNKSNKIIKYLFCGVLKWRSPYLQHNVGAPVNTISSAVYALAMDENIFNIDEGLAGNALVSEFAVNRILSDLAGLKTVGVGFFTFGGSATNLYATKIGLKKAAPNSDKSGVPKNIKMYVTEDSHFSHVLSANWIGIGTNNVLYLKASDNLKTDLDLAKESFEKELIKGNKISTIILNGGTTYDHTIDKILDFVKLRDTLVKKYKLNYKPHIHVDSVIGWSWLFFNKYDFKINPLKISEYSLKLIKKQNKLISELKYADSWGVDFHKGIGGCPVSCSFYMCNNPNDINFLSKTNSNIEMHQLGREFNYYSPADYTFETSRPSGASLSALAVLHSLGIEGFQRNLAVLIEGTTSLRKRLNKEKDFFVSNNSSLGFSTMIRFYPPEVLDNKWIKEEFNSTFKENLEFIQDINNYMKEFFKWDFENRIKKNNGPSYSFSSTYKIIKGVKISAIKIYPVSPHFNSKFGLETAEIFIKQKRIFDKEIWLKK